MRDHVVASFPDGGGAVNHWRRMRDALREHLADALWRQTLSMADCRVIRDIPVWYVCANDETARRLVERMQTALGSIALMDPRRFARMRRDVACILINPRLLGAAASYLDRHRCCVLSDGLVLRGSIDAVVNTIVHEATHARLRRFPYATPDQRLRQERLCVGQELAFLERCEQVQRGEGSHADLFAQLAEAKRGQLATLDASRYTDTVLRERVRDDPRYRQLLDGVAGMWGARVVAIGALLLVWSGRWLLPRLVEALLVAGLVVLVAFSLAAAGHLIRQGGWVYALLMLPVGGAASRTLWRMHRIRRRRARRRSRAASPSAG